MFIAIVVDITDDSRSQLLILVRGTVPWCEAGKRGEQQLRSEAPESRLAGQGRQGAGEGPRGRL